MEGLRQYAISVVRAAFLCSILTRIASQNSEKNLMRLISGLILTIVMIRPVSRIQLSSMQEISIPKDAAAYVAAEEGKELAEESMNDIIKSTCEAYILNKATALGADVHVSVSVNSQHIPFAARITGDVTPEIRKQLAQTLETDLGITKENQSWTG